MVSDEILIIDILRDEAKFFSLGRSPSVLCVANIGDIFPLAYDK